MIDERAPDYHLGNRIRAEGARQHHYEAQVPDCKTAYERTGFAAGLGLRQASHLRLALPASDCSVGYSHLPAKALLYDSMYKSLA